MQEERADLQEDDWAAIEPPLLVRIAGGLCMLTGLFTAVQAIQLWGFVLLGLVKIVPYLMLGMGVAAIGVGFHVQRLRGWAAATGMGLCGFLVLVQSGWVVFGLAQGFVSLVGFGIPPAALAATVLCALALPASFRADLARRRLAADGLNTGT